MKQKLDIEPQIAEDSLPLFQWYKKIHRDGTGFNEKLQKAIGAGFAIVGHDANYVFALSEQSNNHF